MNEPAIRLEEQIISLFQDRETLVYKVKSAEKEMNMVAKESWRVVAVSQDIAKPYGMIITYERKKD